MLLLIGLGLNTKDISVRAVEAIRNADGVLLERYTSFITDEYVKYLEEAAGKKIAEIYRTDLEENVKVTVSQARDKDVAILFPGDPLIATTHKIIIEAAKDLKIKTKVFHAPSILTAAIGESGLDAYRFGPITTIPFWYERYKPTSFLEVVKRNMQNNEHTLLLADIDREGNSPMRLGYAVQILKTADEEKGYGLVKEDTHVIVVANAGREDGLVLYDRIARLEKYESGTKGKAISIIMMAKLSFAEEEAVRRL